MKKFFIILLSTIVLITLLIGIQYKALKNTNEVPYCNLTKFSSADYYIFCNAIYKGESYLIVCGNFKLAQLFSSEKGVSFRPFYSLWMKEVIKNNWNIRMTDKMYSWLKYDIVKNEYIKKHEERKTIDKIISSKGILPEGLSADDYKAIVYLLLKNGINCNKNSESGGIMVNPDGT